MISVEDYSLQVTSGIVPLPAKEQPLERTLGTTLAANIEARVAVPPFTNSAMDGFAVRAVDVQGASKDAGVTLPVFADVAAGATANAMTKPGFATRIMTGAALPEGADAVVKVEDTNIAPGPVQMPDQVTIFNPVQPGTNVRQAGENVAVGDLILQAGIAVTPQVLAAAASVGYGKLPVIPKPRVAIISTGSELKDPGSALAHGQIPDSNSIMLDGLARSLGAKVTYRGRSGDEPEHLEEMLHEAGGCADLIITSGGVSAGAFDPVKIVGKNHDFSFQKVAMQPGKPQGHGTINVSGRDVPVICLPGNPVSVYVSFVLFVRPIIALLGGRSESKLQAVPALAGTSFKSAKNRRQYAPVRAQLSASGITVYPTHAQASGSHLIATLHHATGLAVIAADVDEVAEGDLVQYIPL
ncbi:molybdopterin molybdotransferase MoeA [Gleimia europaea]|uniref:Molybdopterin molybdenumtransferase n=1 Tax=Gleimia europaea ACS-120-V-Col10b TaxID=883069 RepID=A0A9W5VWD1_9ACTO|nr:gephyrin-like molybdotransferase Glp [Gleimia europaea]EPD30784.1 molybdenum cofactor synthesis domain-containing protein [Gleimia europaea ACS-120-V-Col10b]